MRLTFLIVLLTSVTTISAQTLRVMTYNIRYDNTGDGVNQWVNRKDKVAELIRKNNPDIIGLQEALQHQLRDLLLLLPDYTSYGVGRDDGKDQGEFSALLVRHSRFGVLKDSTFWLSETPEIPGSKGWDAMLPRVATWAKLYDRESKKDILCINTHFDHIGVQARTNSAILINDFLANYYKRDSIALIMTGDLNVERSTDAFRVLTKSKLMWDSKPRNNNEPTACGFLVKNRKCSAIDYVLHSPETIARGYKVIRDNDGKFYPSDHLPVIVKYEFNERK